MAKSASQAWLAVSEADEGLGPGPTPFTRVLRQILQRGKAPPIHPESERSLFANLEWDDRVVPSALPGDLGLEPRSGESLPEEPVFKALGGSEFEASSSLTFGSAEERVFYEDWIPANLGAAAGRWFIPQAPLDDLLRSHDRAGPGNRRVDFLASPPGGNPFVVEIDGSQHDDAEQVDDDRDARLEDIGISVIRIPASQVRAGSGPKLRTVQDRWSRPRTSGLSSPVENALLTPVHVHRLALAFTEGIERGFLEGDRWVVEVREDVGRAASVFEPYLDLFLALDILWGARVMPTDLVLGDGHTWKIYHRASTGYDSVATARSEPEDDEVDLRVRLESDKTAVDRLPTPAGNTPEIVLRSASLPVRLSVAEPIGDERHLPEVPDDERGDEALRGILRGLFAKEGFREGQLQALRQILSGEDCALLLPTGAGKSLVYQLAGLCTPGITLIVDPIVSLMEDQRESLRHFGVDRAIAISSHATRQGLRELLMANVASGEELFVFVAPERLQQQEFRDALRTVVQNSPLALAVIDEAHCVSEWGHDFRTSYLNLARVLRNVGRDVRRAAPPVLALTGTASRAILNDMLVELDIDPGIPGTVIKPESFDRPELNLSVVKVEPDESLPTLRGKLENLPARFHEDGVNFFRPRGRDTNSGIVFCPHVNGEYGVVKVAEWITQSTGVPAVTYSGSSPNGIEYRDWEFSKRDNAQAFRENEAPLLVSTKAFGMGIDKPNIRYVVHYGMPGSIEAYYQQAGRAGRDRQRAECILLLIEFDEDRARRLLSEETSLEEMREEREEISRSAADDISRQLFFHLNSFPGIDDEVATLNYLIEDLGELGERRREEIAFEGEDDGREERERALHRLVILGVVRDYLLDWGAQSFDVRLETTDSQEVVENALQYVRRTQPGRYQTEKNRLQPLQSEELTDTVLGAAQNLIRFIYRTIERSRRRSLREMWLAARESALEPEVEFRQRILDYLTEGELVPRLEELVDLDEFAFDDWTEFYADVANPEEARELRGSVARLLSSYPDHPGLLAARALSEIEMPDGDLREYYSNLENALGSAIERYGSSERDLRSFGEWALERCEQLSADRAFTATVALLDRHGIAEDVVEEIERDALRGERSDPALSVLGLSRALERHVEKIERVVNA